MGMCIGKKNLTNVLSDIDIIMFNSKIMWAIKSEDSRVSANYLIALETMNHNIYCDPAFLKGCWTWK